MYLSMMSHCSDDDDMYTEKGRDKLEKYKQTGVEDEEGLQAIIGDTSLALHNLSHCDDVIRTVRQKL